jgi:hypothetical protein
LWQVYGHIAPPKADRITPIEAVLGQEPIQSSGVWRCEPRISARTSRRRKQQPSEFEQWPKGYEPAAAHVFAHNEIVIPAPPDRVWEWLTRARQWPHWYPNSWHIEIPRSRFSRRRDQLESETMFTWLTFGLRITAMVQPYDRPQTIGWKWHSRLWARSAYGYHIWSIEAQPYGCRVVTEETQRGLMPWLLRFGLQPALHLSHQLWLRRLSENAIGGLPR